MSQVLPLDRVIRQVDAEYTTYAPTDRVVIIDAERHSFVPKRPLLSLFRDLRYYAVQTSGDARNFAQGQVSGFQLQDLLHSVAVSVAYEVRCRPGNEVRVAMALFDGSASPGEVLERSLHKWVSELKEQGIYKFVCSYVADKAALEATIADKALAEIGLDLKAHLTIDAERVLGSITVARDHVRVLVSDYQDEPHEVDVRVTLDVDPAYKANAIIAARQIQQLHEIVPKEIAAFIRQHVTMQVFCTSLNGNATRQALAQHLDAVLLPYGRRVGALRLDANAPELQFFVQTSIPVTCRLHEYPQPVVISNEAQLILRDIARFKASGVSDVTRWLQEKLDSVIPQLLFGVKYIEVLIRFEGYEREIKRSVSEEAAAIGYEIKQLITVPDLEPIRLKEAFTIHPSGTFELRLPNFLVKLQVVVTLRIPRLEVVEDPLNRLQSVPKLMEDTIVTATRQYLHGVHPERFYMRFAYTDLPDEQAVEYELTKKIRNELQTHFGAEVIEVVLKVGDTDIIARLRDLQNQIHPFAVRLESVHESEVTTIEGNFQVDMVDSNGWSRFQQLTIGIPEICRLLEQHIFSRLQTVNPQLVQYRDPRHHHDFEQYVGQMATRYMTDQFGLVVRVTNVRRTRTTGEQNANAALIAAGEVVALDTTAAYQGWAAAQAATRDEQFSRLRILLAERSALATTSGTEQEVAELDARIAETRAALQPERLPTFDHLHRTLLPPPAPDMTLRDLAQLSAGAERPLPLERALRGDAE